MKSQNKEDNGLRFFNIKRSMGLSVRSSGFFNAYTTKMISVYDTIHRQLLLKSTVVADNESKVGWFVVNRIGVSVKENKLLKLKDPLVIKIPAIGYQIGPVM